MEIEDIEDFRDISQVIDEAIIREDYISIQSEIDIIDTRDEIETININKEEIQ